MNGTYLNYNKLWKLLIDRGLKKIDLQTETGIAANTMTKLRHNEAVSMDVMYRICLFLGCNIGDVMEFDLRAAFTHLP